MDTARKREGRLMSAISWVRNTLILGGIGAGALIAVHAAVKAPEVKPGQQADQPQVPVILNTAQTQPGPVVQLARPLSLESAMGRTELTGREVLRVPADPLFELDIVREYDSAPGRIPPLPAIERQPRRADDEFSPGDEPETPGTVRGSEALRGLPVAARESAESGLKELEAGNALMHDGLAILRGQKAGETLDDVDKKLSAARRHFETARNQFREALGFAPEHAGLLDLMQETKTNLYTCAKHGRSR